MKRKININRPEISADEINQRKNFDSTLNQFSKISTKPFFKKPWFLSSIAVVTVAIIATVVFNKADEPLLNSTEILSSSDSLALEEFYAKEEAKPCVNPPIKGIDIPYAVYKVNSTSGATLDYKTGSVLTIPKNAFADENGKLITGEVEVHYREFHDPVDFLVSGIPMTYDSAGVRYHFESAGMMEILAFKDGKKVNMMPAKEINVELASKDDSPEYNLYSLDTIKNNWSCIGKDKISKKKENLNPKQLNQIDSSSTNKPKELVRLETKKVEIEKKKEEQIAALPKKPIEPKKPAQANKESYTFNLEVDSKEFPELAIYKDALFEMPKGTKNFNSQMYQITWDDALLTKKDNGYSLTLKKNGKANEYTVYPVFEGKSYEAALATFNEKFKQYTTIKEKRTIEEKRIEEEYNAKLAALKKEQEEYLQAMIKKENERFKSLDTESQIIRTFTLSQFGVFNCDRSKIYPQGVLCNAQLNNDVNDKLMCYDIFLVDKNINGMFTFSRNPIISFTFNPNSKNILWTVENGQLYYLKPEDFKSITKSNGLQKIAMKTAPASLKTIEDIKTFFEI